MRYSITRALAERKVLIKRHEKLVKELELIAVRRGSRLVGSFSHIKPEDFQSRVKESWQSILSIEKRIDLIKYEIDKSNLTSKITIGSKEMTIQEALVLKNSIALKKSRLLRMKQRFMSEKNSFDKALEENKARVEKTVSDTTSSSTTKVDPEFEKTVVKQLDALYGVEFEDPIGLEVAIKQLESEIEEFESNVDYALSESNSQTFIEIPD